MLELETAIGGLDNAFAEALDRSPDSLVEGDYRIAGYPVHLRIAGPKSALAIDRALAHLRAPPGASPALTVDIWDDESVGPIAWAPWPEDVDFYGTMSIDTENRFILHQRPYSIMLLDRQKNHIVGSVRGLSKQYLDERARPFHRLLSIWLNDRDIQFIHAGLVAKGGMGLLFVGKGGSGKTTSSVACFLNGFDYLSDDFVGFQAVVEGNFIGHSLYGTCLIDRVERFPQISRIAEPPNYDFEHKSVVFLADHPVENRFATETPISAVILPRVVDRQETTYRPAKPTEALLALAPSSVAILPHAAPRSLDKLSQLVSATPAFWLELGTDVEQIAPRVEQLCDELTV